MIHTTLFCRVISPGAVATNSHTIKSTLLFLPPLSTLLFLGHTLPLSVTVRLWPKDIYSGADFSSAAVVVSPILVADSGAGLLLLLHFVGVSTVGVASACCPCPCLLSTRSKAKPPAWLLIIFQQPKLNGLMAPPPLLPILLQSPSRWPFSYFSYFFFCIVAFLGHVRVPSQWFIWHYIIIISLGIWDSGQFRPLSGTGSKARIGIGIRRLECRLDGKE